MSAPIPVIWLSLHDGIDARGPWDTAILERLFAGDEWDHGLEFEHWNAGNDGLIRRSAEIMHLAVGHHRAIVVVPARHHVGDAGRINLLLRHFESVLLILCGDEEGKFPWKDIRHPNILFWAQMPDPEHYSDMHDYGFFFGNGVPRYAPNDKDKTVAWVFSGQVTNTRRRQAEHGLRRMPGRLPSILHTTDGFAKGLDGPDYLAMLDSAWIAPAPSGPCNVDTFRAYEALEHGCIPLVDRGTPAGPNRYWEFVYDEVPFPIINDWEAVGGNIEAIYDHRHRLSATCSAWWQQRKREMTWRLRHDLAALGFDVPGQRVTAIVTTSPVPDNPSLDNIRTTIESIRHHFGDIEIIVACDGVRPEQEHLRDAYNVFLFELCRWTERQSNIVPYIASEWRHQAMLTFEALTELGCNRLILFAEHDTPLVVDEPIDVEGAIHVLTYGLIDLLRFHHESYILKPHEHLMVDHKTLDLDGLPVRRTLQWSQRPHLARASYYLDVLGTHFTRASRTMIEDKMHSVVQSAPFGDHRLAIYHPETGNIKRSYHLDARGDEPKFEMKF